MKAIEQWAFCCMQTMRAHIIVPITNYPANIVGGWKCNSELLYWNAWAFIKFAAVFSLYSPVGLISLLFNAWCLHAANDSVGNGSFVSTHFFAHLRRLFFPTFWISDEKRNTNEANSIFSAEVFIIFWLLTILARIALCWSNICEIFH